MFSSESRCKVNITDGTEVVSVRLIEEVTGREAYVVQFVSHYPIVTASTLRSEKVCDLNLFTLWQMEVLGWSPSGGPKFSNGSGNDVSLAA